MKVFSFYWSILNVNSCFKLSKKTFIFKENFFFNLILFKNLYITCWQHQHWAISMPSVSERVTCNGQKAHCKQSPCRSLLFSSIFYQFTTFLALAHKKDFSNTLAGFTVLSSQCLVCSGVASRAHCTPAESQPWKLAKSVNTQVNRPMHKRRGCGFFYPPTPPHSKQSVQTENTASVRHKHGSYMLHTV